VAANSIVRTEKEKYNRSYLMPVGVKSRGENARNPELAKEFRLSSEQVVRMYFIIPANHNTQN
jgi:hypothetical protein